MSSEQGLKPYEPELGQWAFGAPTGEFELGELEDWVVSSLRTIATLTKVKELGRNYGGHAVNFQNGVFEMRNYHWCTESCPPEPEDCSDAALPNFKSGDVEIRWYKHLGRGVSVNREVTREELTEVFQRCRESLVSAPPTANSE